MLTTIEKNVFRVNNFENNQYITFLREQKYRFRILCLKSLRRTSNYENTYRNIKKNTSDFVNSAVYKKR